MTPRLVGQLPTYFERDVFGGIGVDFAGARMRLVHAQRARKLRRRGEFVLRMPRLSDTGRAIYFWFVAGPEPLSLEVPGCSVTPVLA